MKASLIDAMKAASGERRIWRRYPVSMTILVQRVPEDGRPWTEREKARRFPIASAVVTDISLSGLVFVSPRPYPPGSLVEMQFNVGAEVFSIQAIVRRRQTLLLPGRRAFQCAAQLVRGEGIGRFIPRVAKYLHQRAESGLDA